MDRKNQHPSLDVHRGLRTDYILMAAGVGAALIAFGYLLLS